MLLVTELIVLKYKKFATYYITLVLNTQYSEAKREKSHLKNKAYSAIYQ